VGFLPPGRQPQIRSPVVETVPIPMFDDEPGARWCLQQQAVHIDHLALALRSGIELSPDLVNAPLVRQEQP
jgi:hypothetical protein